jgi:hypothetical protein
MGAASPMDTPTRRLILTFCCVSRTLPSSSGPTTPAPHQCASTSRGRSHGTTAPCQRKRGRGGVNRADGGRAEREAVAGPLVRGPFSHRRRLAGAARWPRRPALLFGRLPSKLGSTIQQVHAFSSSKFVLQFHA